MPDSEKVTSWIGGRPAREGLVTGESGRTRENLVVARSGQEALAKSCGKSLPSSCSTFTCRRWTVWTDNDLDPAAKKNRHNADHLVTAFADEVRVAQGYAHGQSTTFWHGRPEVLRPS